METAGDEMTDKENNHTEMAFLARAAERAVSGELELSVPEAASKNAKRILAALQKLTAQKERIQKLHAAEMGQRQAAISGITHDVRVPLTAMMGCAEALRTGLVKTPEKKKAYLDAIVERGQELSSLIDQLSQTNKNAKPFLLHPKPVQMARLIQNDLMLWKETLEENRMHIILSLDESIILPLDSIAFRRVISNLISNTAKYRIRPESLIHISLKKENGHAVLTYQDDGPGVSSKEALTHLFEPGYRAPETESAVPGTGLGLYIIAQIIKEHGGSLSAKSENGLTIRITLPIQGGTSC